MRAHEVGAAAEGIDEAAERRVDHGAADRVVDVVVDAVLADLLCKGSTPRGDEQGRPCEVGGQKEARPSGKPGRRASPREDEEGQAKGG